MKGPWKVKGAGRKWVMEGKHFKQRGKKKNVQSPGGESEEGLADSGQL